MKYAIIKNDTENKEVKLSLLKQKHYYKHNRPQESKQKYPWWLSLIIIVIGIYFYPDLIGDNSSDKPDTIFVQQETLEAFNGMNFEIFPKETKIPIKLRSVTDGDTIRAQINDQTFTIRYLMINTPEMNYEEGRPEPFAQAAKDYNEKLLEASQQVYLVFDKGPYTDNYQRALAYVYADDKLVSEEIIAAGLGVVRYVNPPNNSMEDELRKAEEAARVAKLNLWR